MVIRIRWAHIQPLELQGTEGLINNRASSWDIKIQCVAATRMPRKSRLTSALSHSPPLHGLTLSQFQLISLVDGTGYRCQSDSRYSPIDSFHFVSELRTPTENCILRCHSSSFPSHGAAFPVLIAGTIYDKKNRIKRGFFF